MNTGYSKFLSNLSDAQTKRHSILPSSVCVQLINQDGSKLNVDLVLMHLKIFITKGSYHNFNFIPTDEHGLAKFSRADILNNTELKHYFDANLSPDNTPVDFEISVYTTEFLKTMIDSMDGFLPFNEESVRSELLHRGISEKEVEERLPLIEKKLNEDELLLTLLKSNNNQQIEEIGTPEMIQGKWESSSHYSYELKIGR